jgi:site-specific DNA-methyltransferase (adenine-specific)
VKPYYEQDGITIYHGCAREVLRTIPDVDLVVMDPPYGMEFQSNHRQVKHRAIVGDESLPLDLINLAIGKASRAAYVFCRWDNLADMPKPRSVIAWVKNNWSMGDLAHEHGRQWEACCFYPRAGHQFIKRIPDVIYADRTGNNFHPTEKPEALMQKIIAANVGDVVLDACMGSGTTLVAAKVCGRRAIGVEVDERYCEIAAKRLAQGVLFGTGGAA